MDVPRGLYIPTTGAKWPEPDVAHASVNPAALLEVPLTPEPIGQGPGGPGAGPAPEAYAARGLTARRRRHGGEVA